MALTPEEEQRKSRYSEVSNAWMKAGAQVFFNGDEDAAWRALYEMVDKEKVSKAQEATPQSARVHLKATHQ